MGQTIAIISALHEEQAGLRALMPGQRPERLGGREFWRGQLQGHEVIAVLSGIGKVAAATTTAVLLERFQPQQLIFTGVAGGIGDGVAVGDIVVGSSYLQHDMDASPLFARHELPGYSRSRLPADPRLLALMEQAAEEAIAWLPRQLDPATRAAFGLHSPRVHRGNIITGDRFVATAAESRAANSARRWRSTWRARQWHRSATTMACRSAPCARSRTAPTTRPMSTFRPSCSRSRATTAAGCWRRRSACCEPSPGQVLRLAARPAHLSQPRLRKYHIGPSALATIRLTT